MAAATSFALAAGGAAGATRLVRERQGRRARIERARRFRLEPGEGVAEGVRRIARGQIDLVVDRLAGIGGRDADPAVHESRKALKRLRALLRLIRPELGEKAYRRESECFRDAGRALSRARDARVVADTLETLCERHRDELPEDAFDTLHGALVSEAESARRGLLEETGTLREVTGELGRARTRVAAWPLAEEAGLELLAPGLERIHARGRAATRAAREEPGSDALHDLRKRTKDLWHAAQVVESVAPGRAARVARDARRLSDLIGEDHDLSVLASSARARAGKLRPGELELLEALVARRRARLRRDALRRAGELYRRKPRKVAAKLTRPAS